MHPVLFKIGPLTIYTYGFFVFLGVWFAYLVVRRAAILNGIDQQKFDRLFFWGIIWGFISARLAYILVEFNYFITDPLAVIFSRSGFIFYGGIIGGFIALYYQVRRNQFNLLSLLDSFALGLPLAHGFGRLGCFFYGCCYGRTTDSWLGVLFPASSPAGLVGAKVIPTQLIEALFLFLLFVLLSILARQKKNDGSLILTYIFSYGAFRFIIEFFRADQRGFVLGLATSQVIALAMVLLSAIYLIKLRQIKK